MYALRKNLSEVEEHLADRDNKYRELNHEYKTAKQSWAIAEKDYESRIQNLEAENHRLRKLSPNSDDVVTLTRAQKAEVESRFQKTTAELDAKTKECESLQLQLRLLESRTSPAVVQDVTEAQVVTLFTKLRERIRDASMNRFNESTPLTLIPQKSRDELNQLSSKWKSYMGSNLIRYLLRALIWRYVHFTLFVKAGKIWGPEIRGMLKTFSGIFSPDPELPNFEYKSWRIETGRLLHKKSKIDDAVLNEVMTHIFEATKHFAIGKDEELKKSIHEIVMIGAELTDIFERSYYEPLMSDKPGSVLTRGFRFEEKTMEIKARLGTNAVVDMMITPCLLKNDGNYDVLAKAEVIC